MDFTKTCYNPQLSRRWLQTWVLPHVLRGSGAKNTGPGDENAKSAILVKKCVFYTSSWPERTTSAIPYLETIIADTKATSENLSRQRETGIAGREVEHRLPIGNGTNRLR